MTVYPVELVTPDVPVSSPVIDPVCPVVYPLTVWASVVPPIVGVDPPPILPKTPNPNNNPKIRANKAKIPNNGHNQLGHPSFFFLVLVSSTWADSLVPTFDLLTYGAVSSLGC